MSLHLSRRALLLKPSPTLALAAKAKELQVKGLDVVSLTVGEPDWATFSGAADAGIEAIRQGKTKYTPASGNLDLKTEIALHEGELLNTAYKPSEVVVGAGAKFVIFAALQMLVERGDEVLIPSPYWVSYPTMVELTDATPVIIACGEKENFKLTAEQLKKAITPKTRVLILCGPNNPTGIAYTKQELAAMAEILKAHPEVVVISDDIYNRLIWTGERVAPHLLHVAPELKERILVVNGASKSYAMTGWRIGWALGPQRLITLMGDYMSQSTSNPSSISQAAALVALKTGENEILRVQKELRGRFEMCSTEFLKMKYLKLVPSQGAFYLWVDARGLLGKTHQGSVLASCKEIAQVLLEKYLVATVPGGEFGSNGYLRLSFAASEADLLKAFARFREFENSL